MKDAKQAVIDLARKGHSNKEIADQVGASDYYVGRILTEVYRERRLNGWGNPRVRLALARHRRKAVRS